MAENESAEARIVSEFSELSENARNDLRKLNSKVASEFERYEVSVRKHYTNVDTLKSFLPSFKAFVEGDRLTAVVFYFARDKDYYINFMRAVGTKQASKLLGLLNSISNNGKTTFQYDILSPYEKRLLHNFERLGLIKRKKGEVHQPVNFELTKKAFVSVPKKKLSQIIKTRRWQRPWRRNPKRL